MDNIGNRIVLLCAFLFLIGVAITYSNIKLENAQEDINQEPTYKIYQINEELVRIEQVSNGNYNYTTIDSVSYYLELNNH